MAEVGEIRLSKGNSYQIFSLCRNCGKGRWTSKWYEENRNQVCQECHHARLRLNRGEDAPRWNGGRIKDGFGYIKIKLQPGDFFYSMCNKIGYVAEHRLIIARELNRCLLPWEIVHHKNGTKDDNQRDNLELMRGEHNHNAISTATHQLKAKIALLQKKVKEQQLEIMKLRNV